MSGARKYGWTTDPNAYCEAVDTGDAEGLRCDLHPDHEGETHVEQGVAVWRPDGTVERWTQVASR